MEDFMIGFAIVAVVIVACIYAMRPQPLTKQEKDFVQFIHDQARQGNLTRKEDLRQFVSDQFEQMEAVYAINGLPSFRDMSRIKKVIVDTYKHA